MKLKTKSSAKKRFRITCNLKVLSAHACKRHNLRKRSQKAKRLARGTHALCAADARIISRYMPYR